ncbi:hypothetical protein JCM30471_29700 [Desulfuromonas carbonis]
MKKIDPRTIQIPKEAQGKISRGDAAINWFKFGLMVIPVSPGEKRTAVKWDDWQEDLSAEKISAHWSKHPAHDLGFIVGDDLIVFDADTPEAVKSLQRVEEEYGARPSMIVRTTKGEHHYFRKEEGTWVKTTGHGEGVEQKIDIKTGRTMVVLPPSPGKEVITCNVQNVAQFTKINQGFIDSIFLMIGKAAPRPEPAPRQSLPQREPTEDSFRKIKALLEHLSADSGYEVWTKVLMAIYHETGGSEEGLELADNWSRRGTKYKGRREIEAKWRSFREVSNPVTIATLVKLAKDNEADIAAILDLRERFKPCETIVAYPENAKETTAASHPLARFSLTGQSEELERKAAARIAILGEVAVLGQLTVLYASPNTGKTLLTLKLLTESIEAGRIDPEKVFYLNMDDDSRGLVEKLKIAEEFGFHMLAEGYNGFSAEGFINEVRSLIRNDLARGVVIVLDTLKKFVDLMNKSHCRDFNLVLGQYAAKGGTLIALAHTNKKGNADGKPIHAGTTDVREDFSCAYTMRLISGNDSQEKIVLFEELKSRGLGAEKASYRYVSGKDIGYNEMFMSVEKVDERQFNSKKQAEAMRSDAEIIDAVKTCIGEGVNTKMVLAEAAAKRSGASKRSVLQLIDRYTGDDPAKHQWNFVRGERGKQTFSVLNSN